MLNFGSISAKKAQGLKIFVKCSERRDIVSRGVSGFLQIIVSADKESFEETSLT